MSETLDAIKITEIIKLSDCTQINLGEDTPDNLYFAIKEWCVNNLGPEDNPGDTKPRTWAMLYDGHLGDQLQISSPEAVTMFLLRWG